MAIFHFAKQITFIYILEKDYEGKCGLWTLSNKELSTFLGFVSIGVGPKKTIIHFEVFKILQRDKSKNLFLILQLNVKQLEKQIFPLVGNDQVTLQWKQNLNFQLTSTIFGYTFRYCNNFSVF